MPYTKSWAMMVPVMDTTVEIVRFRLSSAPMKRTRPSRFGFAQPRCPSFVTVSSMLLRTTVASTSHCIITRGLVRGHVARLHTPIGFFGDMYSLLVGLRLQSGRPKARAFVRVQSTLQLDPCPPECCSCSPQNRCVQRDFLCENVQFSL